MLYFLFFHLKLWWFFGSFYPCVRTRGGVPPLHAAVPRGAAPRGAPTSRAPSSRGRGVQRARGAPPAAGYRPAPPIVQDTYGEYVSILTVCMSVKISWIGSWSISTASGPTHRDRAAPCLQHNVCVYPEGFQVQYKVYVIWVVELFMFHHSIGSVPSHRIG